MTNSSSALRSIPDLAQVYMRLLESYACGRCPHFKALATRLLDQAEQKGVFHMNVVGASSSDDAVLFLFLTLLAEEYGTSEFETRMKVSF